MQRHQKHFIIVGFHAINIRNQRNLLQKAAQRRILVCRFKCNHLGNQFVDVGDSVLRILVIRLLQLFYIAGGFYDIIQQLF